MQGQVKTMPLHILIVASMLMTACAARGATAGGRAEAIPGVWAVAHDGDLWLARPGAPQHPLTHLHLPATEQWGELFWATDGEQIAATYADMSDPASPPTLVIANIATGATTQFDQAIDLHHHLAGWITDDQVLLAGDPIAPGLLAFDTTTQTMTAITAEAPAAYTMTLGSVYFVTRQQHVQDGALLSRWDARDQTTITAAYLPGFAVDAAGLACGRLHLSVDGSAILYDSIFDGDGVPCSHPAGPWLMWRDGGTATLLFGGQPGIDGAFRDFTLDPAGQWVAAADVTPNGGITTYLESVGGAAPITLPIAALAGASQITLSPAQDALAITAPDHENTRVALITPDGHLFASGTLQGLDAAVAPPPGSAITVSTDDIQCARDADPVGGDGLHVAVIGDSLAQGFGTSDPAQCSFAEQLQDMRMGNGHAIRLMAQGMGGYRVDQMLTTLPALVAFAPDVVVIELGTNDAREHWPPAQTRAAYDTIVTTLHGVAGIHFTHPTILCLETWPSPGFDTSAQLAPYDAIIAQVCAQSGSSAVDIAPLMVAGMTNSTLAPDFNWHPNDRGALNLARLIASVFAAAG
jgi:lysophospholipase L1-like esterase